MTMKRFPAVLVGGPPDSGKSVLTANLTQTLYRQKVQHYVLRICPDGEGNWQHMAEQKQVRILLAPGAWTPEFVDHLCHDLAHPHLPLIVGAGGRPRPWQKRIFDYCTHAILLTPDDASRAHWRTLMARHSVPIIADLRSTPNGQDDIDGNDAILRGTIAGLRWGHTARGPVFQALAERLGRLFHFAPAVLRQAHLDSAPAEIVVELDRLKRTLRIGGDPLFWEPESLPRVIDYLPAGMPLALYGRAPNWLNVALGLLAFPAELVQFDVRLGWVSPPQVTMRRSMTVMDNKMIMVKVQRHKAHTRLDFSLPYSFVDILDARGLDVVDVSLDRGVILSGKLPHWLIAGIALAYREAPWIGIYQPMLDGAVVVWSQNEQIALGNVIKAS